MNTPEETTLLAAADRLRRCSLGINLHQIRELYAGVTELRGPDWEVAAVRADRATLADAMLAAIPAGPEPVAIEQPSGAELKSGENCPAWVATEDGVFQMECACHSCCREFRSAKADPTEADARLALAWRRFRQAVGQE